MTGHEIRFEMLLLGAAISITEEGTRLYTLCLGDDYAQLEFIPEVGYGLEVRKYGVIKAAASPRSTTKLWRWWQGKRCSR